MDVSDRKKKKKMNDFEISVIILCKYDRIIFRYFD